MANPFSRWFLSERPPNCHVADLETSLDPHQTLLKVQKYKPALSDWVHYIFLGSIMLFVFITNPAPWIFKILFYCFLGTLFIIPATSQFFFNALPILTWVALYFTSSYFPDDRRPPITVKVLPAVETILYGDNLSDILATSTNSFLDILAWLPYGLFHYGAPFVVAAILFVFGPPTVLQGYAFAFGYMNLFGVIMQNVFPAAPPWYKILYGLQSANYDMHGSPGGLARIDKLLGINMYTTAFSNSSVIFGAFPSLHSGCATMEALFFCYCFPKLKPLFIAYVCWLWWSTMYLTHHYFVDLMAGSVLSYVIFQYTKYTHLPIVDTSLFCRWSYTSIEKYDISKSDPLAADSNDIESVPLSNLELDFDLNMTDEPSVSPSLFDGSTSVSRSSATSITSLGVKRA
nr:Aur1p [Saccharomyces cerevisiae]